MEATASVIDFVPRARRSGDATYRPILSADGTRRFADEVWLTPMEIAKKWGYATSKPIAAAIARGELVAHKAPCGRKRMVAEADYFRWVDEHLAHAPTAAATTTPARARKPAVRSVRKRPTPTLNYSGRRPRSTDG
jgi:hypothetical protein